MEKDTLRHGLLGLREACEPGGDCVVAHGQVQVSRPLGQQDRQGAEVLHRWRQHRLQIAPRTLAMEIRLEALMHRGVIISAHEGSRLSAVTHSANG